MEMIGCFPSISNKVVGPGFPQFFQVECFITPISRVYFTSVTMEGVHLEANFCVFFHQTLNGTESQRTPDQVSCELELWSILRGPGVREKWVLLEISWIFCSPKILQSFQSDHLFDKLTGRGHDVRKWGSLRRGCSWAEPVFQGYPSYPPQSYPPKKYGLIKGLLTIGFP